MDQLALFDQPARPDIDHNTHDADVADNTHNTPGVAVPRLYASTTRGLQARLDEYTAWIDRHGRFGCVYRARAWHVDYTDPDQPTTHCQATVLTADLRCTCHTGCHCVGALVYRGACSGCPWEGPTRLSRETAVIDALDHACPGWRHDPPVPARPDSDTPHARRAWTATVTTQLGHRPPGWPVTTLRTGPGHRAVPTRSPYGGYDIDHRTLPTLQPPLRESHLHP